MNLLVPEQVAAIAGVKLATLANWRASGRGPCWLRPSAMRRYEAATVQIEGVAQ